MPPAVVGSRPVWGTWDSIDSLETVTVSMVWNPTSPTLAGAHELARSARGLCAYTNGVLTIFAGIALPRTSTLTSSPTSAPLT